MCAVYGMGDLYRSYHLQESRRNGLGHKGAKSVKGPLKRSLSTFKEDDSGIRSFTEHDKENYKRTFITSAAGSKPVKKTKVAEDEIIYLSSDSELSHEDDVIPNSSENESSVLPDVSELSIVHSRSPSYCATGVGDESSKIESDPKVDESMRISSPRKAPLPIVPGPTLDNGGHTFSTHFRYQKSANSGEQLIIKQDGLTKKGFKDITVLNLSSVRPVLTDLFFDAGVKTRANWLQALEKIEKKNEKEHLARENKRHRLATVSKTKNYSRIVSRDSSIENSAVVLPNVRLPMVRVWVGPINVENEEENRLKKLKAPEASLVKFNPSRSSYKEYAHALQTAIKSCSRAMEPSIKPLTEKKVQDDRHKLKGHAEVELIFAHRDRQLASQSGRPLKECVREYLVMWKNTDEPMYQGRYWWLPEACFITAAEKDLLDYYKRREQCISATVARYNKTGVAKSYPYMHERLDFEAPKSANTEYAWRVMLRSEYRRREMELNKILLKQGQAPVYIENWSQSMDRSKNGTPTWPRFSMLEGTICTPAVEESLQEARVRSLAFLGGLSPCSCNGDCGPNDKRHRDCACASTGMQCSFDRLRSHGGNIYVACGPMCSCPPTCSRREIQRGRQFPLLLMHTGTVKGWGMFTCCKIPKASFLGIYMAMLVRESDYAAINMTAYQFQLSANILDPPADADDRSAVDLYPSRILLDAIKYGNETRFFNNGCGNSRNLIAVDVFYGGASNVNQIAFFTTQEIPIGRECMFKYSWGTEATQRCLCSENCPNKL